MEVHQGHGGSNGVGPGLGGPHQGRSRSRAGSISIPAYVDMSPSVEKTYNFGHPQHHQVSFQSRKRLYNHKCQSVGLLANSSSYILHSSTFNLHPSNLQPSYIIFNITTFKLVFRIKSYSRITKVRTLSNVISSVS